MKGSLGLGLALLVFNAGAKELPEGKMLRYAYIEEPARQTQRYFVTNDFIRVDYENDPSSYLLFDRKKHLIFLVSGIDKTILEAVVKPDQVKKDFTSYAAPVLIAPMNTSAPYPAFNGLEGQLYGGYIGDKLCWTSVNVSPKQSNHNHKTFMKALSELYQSLGYLQQDGNPYMQQNRCERLIAVEHVDGFLKKGFPLFWSYFNGSQYYYLNHSNPERTAAHLFTLPSNYQYIRP